MADNFILDLLFRAKIENSAELKAELLKLVKEAGKKSKLDIDIGNTKAVEREIAAILSAVAQTAKAVDDVLKNLASTVSNMPQVIPPVHATQPPRKLPPPEATSPKSLPPPEATVPPQTKTTAASAQAQNIDAVAAAFVLGTQQLAGATADGVSQAAKVTVPKAAAAGAKAASSIGVSFQDMIAALQANISLKPSTSQALSQIPNIRLLSQKHADDLLKSQAQPVTSQTVTKGFSNFTHQSDADFQQLQQNLIDLGSVASQNLRNPANVIAGYLAKIKKLSFYPDEQVRLGSGEEGKFKRTVADFVQNAFRQIVSGMLTQLDALEAELGTAVKAGNEGDIKRIGAAYANVARNTLSVYRQIERSGEEFNINLTRQLGGGGPSGSKGVKPIRTQESSFLAAGGYDSVLKLLENTPTARKAFGMATDFATIKDTSERVKAIFDVLFKEMRAGSTEFRDNMTATIEALRFVGERDLVNRQSIYDVQNALERYKTSYVKLQDQMAGIPAAGVGKVHVPYMGRGEEGVQTDVLAATDTIKRRIAESGLAKGTKIPVTISYEDALGGLHKLNVGFQKLGSTVDKVKTTVEVANVGHTLYGQMGMALRRVSVWGTASGLFYGIIDVFRDVMRVITETETAFVNLAKVMSDFDRDQQGFQEHVRKAASDIAQSYGVSLKSVYEGMAIFGQQGMRMADVESMTEAAAIASNVAQMSQKESAEALTATIRQFGVEASKAMTIVDAWNEVSNRNAVTVLQLADATRKAGSAASTVGVQYEQFLGLVTAIGTATRQPGKEIGTSLKFMFQRTLRPETQQTLEKFGIATRDTEGNFRGFMPILGEISGKWDDLAKSQQLAIAQAVGGALQYNVFLTLMKNFSLAMKATNDAINSNGSAFDENQKMMATLAKKWEQARASLNNFYITLGDLVLPSLKTVADASNNLMNLFRSFPNGVLSTAASLTVLAVAFTKLATVMDSIMLAGGASASGSLFAGLAGWVTGAGKTAAEIEALPKAIQMTQAARTAKTAGDWGAAGLGAAAVMSAGGTKIVDASGTLATNAAGMSKLTMAVKNYKTVSAGAFAPEAIGMSSLNSFVSKFTLAVARVGQLIPSVFASLVAGAAKASVAVLGIGKSFETAAMKFKYSVSSMGTGLSLLFAVPALGILYTGVSALFEKLKNPPKVNFGQQAEKENLKVIASYQAQYKETKSRMSLLEQLSAMEAKVNKESVLPESEQVRRGTVPRLEKYRLEESRSQAGAFMVRIGPQAIEDIDKYGNVITKTGESIRNLSKDAIAAAADMLALAKIPVVSGWAKQASKELKDAQAPLHSIKSLVPIFEAEQSVLGKTSKNTAEYGQISREAFSHVAAQRVALQKMYDVIGSFPEETSLDSYFGLLSDKTISKAMEDDVGRQNRALKKQYNQVASAGDKINQLFIQGKLGKAGDLIGITGAVTFDAVKEKRNVYKQVKDVQKDVEGAKAGDIVLFDKENDFGLTQALVTVDSSGKKFIEGINHMHQEVRVAMEDVRDSLDGTTLVDSKKLIAEVTESVYQLKKKLGGAGAGLITLPIKVDVGAKFNFELGGLDKIQQYGNRATDIYVKAALAQQEYANQVDELSKKTHTATLIDRDRVAVFNELARAASIKTFSISIINELSTITQSFEKAAYEMQKANLADVVESQFSTLFGTAAGFSKNIVPELPKLGSELKGGELVAQQNPSLALATRQADRALELIKQNTIRSRTVYELNLPEMINNMPAKDVNKFSERNAELVKAIAETGGDKGSALVANKVDGVREEIAKQTDILSSGLKDLQPKETQKDKDIRQEKAKQIAAVEGTTGKAPTTRDFITKRYPEYIVQKFLENFGEDVEKARKAKGFSKGLPDVKAKAEEVTQKNISTYAIEKAREVDTRGQGLSRPEMQELKDRYKDALEKAYMDVFIGKEGFPSVPSTPEKPIRRIAWGYKNEQAQTMEGKYYYKEKDYLGSSVTRTAGRVLNWLGDLALGPEKELSGRQQFKNRVLDELVARMKAVESAPPEKFGKLIDDIRARAVEERKTHPVVIEDTRARNLKIADELYKSSAKARAFFAQMSEELTGASSPDAMRVRSMKEMLSSLSFTSAKILEFGQSVQLSVNSLKNFYSELIDLRSLRAPIAGAAAGVPQLKVDLGKFEKELTPEESVYKNFAGTQNIAEQEMVRVQAIDKATAIYKSLQVAVDSIYEVVGKSQAAGKPSPNADNLLAMTEAPKRMFDSLANVLGGVNTQMAPFIDSLRKLTELEKVKQSIRDIVAEMLKLQDLEFDTTSIDIATGRHPLSKTAGVFGQPGNLDKYERELYDLEQKKKAGAIGSQEFSYAKKKLEFDKEEALIQYKQAKETQKLTTETGGAQKAMGILWDAQYKGIGGLDALIATLKDELSTAGESYYSGGQKYFKGTPSLYGMQGDIAKVQEQVAAKGFEQQRDIVMAPLLDVNTQMLTELKNINEAVRAEEGRIKSGAATGTEGLSTLEQNITSLRNTIARISELAVNSNVAAAKAAENAASSTSPVADSFNKVSEVLDKAKDALGGSVSKYGEHIAAMGKLIDSINAAAQTMKEVSEAAGLPTKPRDSGMPTTIIRTPDTMLAGGVVRGYYSGGYVRGGFVDRGPASRDGVHTRLEPGAYVISNAGVDNFGRDGLESLASGASINSLAQTSTVPVRVNRGEFIFNQQQAKNIGYANLDRINKGVGTPHAISGTPGMFIGYTPYMNYVAKYLAEYNSASSYGLSPEELAKIKAESGALVVPADAQKSGGSNVATGGPEEELKALMESVSTLDADQIRAIYSRYMETKKARQAALSSFTPNTDAINKFYKDVDSQEARKVYSFSKYQNVSKMVTKESGTAYMDAQNRINADAVLTEAQKKVKLEAAAAQLSYISPGGYTKGAMLVSVLEKKALSDRQRQLVQQRIEAAKTQGATVAYKGDTAEVYGALSMVGSPEDIAKERAKKLQEKYMEAQANKTALSADMINLAYGIDDKYIRKAGMGDQAAKTARALKSGLSTKEYDIWDNYENFVLSQHARIQSDSEEAQRLEDLSLSRRQQEYSKRQLLANVSLKEKTYRHMMSDIKTSVEDYQAKKSEGKKSEQNLGAALQYDLIKAGQRYSSQMGFEAADEAALALFLQGNNLPADVSGALARRSLYRTDLKANEELRKKFGDFYYSEYEDVQTSGKFVERVKKVDYLGTPSLQTTTGKKRLHKWLDSEGTGKTYFVDEDFLNSLSGRREKYSNLPGAMGTSLVVGGKQTAQVDPETGVTKFKGFKLSEEDIAEFFTVADKEGKKKKLSYFDISKNYFDKIGGLRDRTGALGVFQGVGPDGIPTYSNTAVSSMNTKALESIMSAPSRKEFGRGWKGDLAFGMEQGVSGMVGLTKSAGNWFKDVFYTNPKNELEMARAADTGKELLDEYGNVRKVTVADVRKAQLASLENAVSPIASMAKMVVKAPIEQLLMALPFMPDEISAYGEKILESKKNSPIYQLVSRITPYSVEMRKATSRALAGLVPGLGAKAHKYVPKPSGENPLMGLLWGSAEAAMDLSLFAGKGPLKALKSAASSVSLPGALKKRIPFSKDFIDSRLALAYEAKGYKWANKTTASPAASKSALEEASAPERAALAELTGEGTPIPQVPLAVSAEDAAVKELNKILTSTPETLLREGRDTFFRRFILNRIDTGRVGALTGLGTRFLGERARREALKSWEYGISRQTTKALPGTVRPDIYESMPSMLELEKDITGGMTYGKASPWTTTKGDIFGAPAEGIPSQQFRNYFDMLPDTADRTAIRKGLTSKDEVTRRRAGIKLVEDVKREFSAKTAEGMPEVFQNLSKRKALTGEIQSKSLAYLSDDAIKNMPLSMLQGLMSAGDVGAGWFTRKWRGLVNKGPIGRLREGTVRGKALEAAQKFRSSYGTTGKGLASVTEAGIPSIDTIAESTAKAVAELDAEAAASAASKKAKDAAPIKPPAAVPTKAPAVESVTYETLDDRWKKATKEFDDELNAPSRAKRAEEQAALEAAAKRRAAYEKMGGVLPTTSTSTMPLTKRAEAEAAVAASKVYGRALTSKERAALESSRDIVSKAKEEAAKRGVELPSLEDFKVFVGAKKQRAEIEAIVNRLKKVVASPVAGIDTETSIASAKERIASLKEKYNSISRSATRVSKFKGAFTSEADEAFIKSVQSAQSTVKELEGFLSPGTEWTSGRSMAEAKSSTAEAAAGRIRAHEEGLAAMQKSTAADVAATDSASLARAIRDNERRIIENRVRGLQRNAAKLAQPGGAQAIVKANKGLISADERNALRRNPQYKKYMEGKDYELANVPETGFDALTSPVYPAGWSEKVRVSIRAAAERKAAAQMLEITAGRPKAEVRKAQIGTFEEIGPAVLPSAPVPTATRTAEQLSILKSHEGDLSKLAPEFRRSAEEALLSDRPLMAPGVPAMPVIPSAGRDIASEKLLKLREAEVEHARLVEMRRLEQEGELKGAFVTPELNLFRPGGMKKLLGLRKNADREGLSMAFNSYLSALSFQTTRSSSGNRILNKRGLASRNYLYDTMARMGLDFDEIIRPVGSSKLESIFNGKYSLRELHLPTKTDERAMLESLKAPTTLRDTLIYAEMRSKAASAMEDIAKESKGGKLSEEKLKTLQKKQGYEGVDLEEGIALRKLLSSLRRRVSKSDKNINKGLIPEPAQAMGGAEELGMAAATGKKQSPRFSVSGKPSEKVSTAKDTGLNPLDELLRSVGQDYTKLFLNDPKYARFNADMYSLLSSRGALPAEFRAGAVLPKGLARDLKSITPTLKPGMVRSIRRDLYSSVLDDPTNSMLDYLRKERDDAIGVLGVKGTTAGKASAGKMLEEARARIAKIEAHARLELKKNSPEDYANLLDMERKAGLQKLSEKDIRKRKNIARRFDKLATPGYKSWTEVQERVLSGGMSPQELEKAALQRTNRQWPTGAEIRQFTRRNDQGRIMAYTTSRAGYMGERGVSIQEMQQRLTARGFEDRFSTLSVERQQSVIADLMERIRRYSEGVVRGAGIGGERVKVTPLGELPYGHTTPVSRVTGAMDITPKITSVDTITDTATREAAKKERDAAVARYKVYLSKYGVNRRRAPVGNVPVEELSTVPAPGYLLSDAMALSRHGLNVPNVSYVLDRYGRIIKGRKDNPLYKSPADVRNDFLSSAVEIEKQVVEEVNRYYSIVRAKSAPRQSNPFIRGSVSWFRNPRGKVGSRIFSSEVENIELARQNLMALFDKHGLPRSAVRSFSVDDIRAIRAGKMELQDVIGLHPRGFGGEAPIPKATTLTGGGTGGSPAIADAVAKGRKLADEQKVKAKNAKAEKAAAKEAAALSKPGIPQNEFESLRQRVNSFSVNSGLVRRLKDTNAPFASRYGDIRAAANEVHSLESISETRALTAEEQATLQAKKKYLSDQSDLAKETFKGWSPPEITKERLDIGEGLLGRDPATIALQNKAIADMQAYMKNKGKKSELPANLPPISPVQATKAPALAPGLTQGPSGAFYDKEALFKATMAEGSVGYEAETVLEKMGYTRAQIAHEKAARSMAAGPPEKNKFVDLGMTKEQAEEYWKTGAITFDPGKMSSEEREAFVMALKSSSADIGGSLQEMVKEIETQLGIIGGNASPAEAVLKRKQNLESMLPVVNEAGLKNVADFESFIKQFESGSPVKASGSAVTIHDPTAALKDRSDIVGRMLFYKQEILRNRVDKSLGSAAPSSATAQSRRAAYRSIKANNPGISEEDIAVLLKQQGFFTGGLVRKYASGGYVHGPGTGTSDSIPAMLSKGEFVVPAEAVSRIGAGTLTAMAEGGRVNDLSSREAVKAKGMGGNVNSLIEKSLAGLNIPSEILKKIKETIKVAFPGAEKFILDLAKGFMSAEAEQKKKEAAAVSRQAEQAQAGQVQKEKVYSGPSVYGGGATPGEQASRGYVRYAAGSYRRGGGGLGADVIAKAEQAGVRMWGTTGYYMPGAFGNRRGPVGHRYDKALGGVGGDYYNVSSGGGSHSELTRFPVRGGYGSVKSRVGDVNYGGMISDEQLAKSARSMWKNGVTTSMDFGRGEETWGGLITTEEQWAQVQKKFGSSKYYEDSRGVKHKISDIPEIAGATSISRYEGTSPSGVSGDYFAPGMPEPTVPSGPSLRDLNERLVYEEEEEKKNKFMGGIIRAYKVGGSVFGPGSATSDSIPAMLSKGEYVIPAGAVKLYGGGKAFDKLFKGGKVPGYANGGLVGSFQTGGPVAGASSSFMSILNAMTERVTTLVSALTIAGEEIKKTGETINSTSRQDWIKKMEAVPPPPPGNDKVSWEEYNRQRNKVPPPPPDSLKQDIEAYAKLQNVGPSQEYNTPENNAFDMRAINKAGAEYEARVKAAGGEEALRRDPYNIPANNAMDMKAIDKASEDYIRKVGSMGSEDVLRGVSSSTKQTVETGSDLDKRLEEVFRSMIEDMASKLKETMSSVFDGAKVEISPDSINSLGDQLKKTEVVISQDSITAVNKAVSDGASSIADALKNIPSLGTAAGAATSDEIKVLGTEIQVIRDEMRVASDVALTNINERFSRFDTDMTTKITGEVERNTTPLSTEIGRNSSRLDQLTTLVSQLSSKMNLPR